MTGPEHYEKAQELLREYEEPRPAGLFGGKVQHPTPDEIARAQVHATLALAAATALTIPVSAGGGTPDWRGAVL